MDYAPVYKTFTDGIYEGMLPMKEIHRLRDEAQRLALAKQKEVNADHMVYGHYDLDESGEIVTVWLYSGLPFTDAEFDRVQRLTRCHVFAYHKRP